MFNPRVNSILMALGLQIGRIDLGVQTSTVIVAVRNAEGTSWIGRAPKGPDPDPQEYLMQAFEIALNNFDPEWKVAVEKALFWTK